MSLESAPTAGGPDVLPNPIPEPEREPPKPDPTPEPSPIPPVPEPAQAFSAVYSGLDSRHSSKSHAQDTSLWGSFGCVISAEMQVLRTTERGYFGSAALVPTSV